MAGIIFFKTQHLAQITEFYRSQIGMTVWLDQGGCIILKQENLLLGFCERDEAETSGMITFFYPHKTDVDKIYRRIRDRAIDAPKVNNTYQIYHFFAHDPEQRIIEFQTFLHPLQSYQDGEELLMTRRSIRAFAKTPVSNETLWEIFELCRYAPTSRNTQPCYFVVIRDRKILQFLGNFHEKGSEPILKAPVSVAICADPDISRLHIQDGCIAAYHFMLAATLFGLGTCWIGKMDVDEIKAMLGVSQKHYLTAITPVGYPAEHPKVLVRKDASSIVRFVK